MCISKPSAVVRRATCMTPALLMSRSSRGCAARSSRAAVRTESSEALVSVAAAAHGLAVYLQQRMWTTDPEPLAAAERRAECMARALVAQARAAR